jgi:NAD(P)-dependent dehydrogenase (short-subunit alcohol dehydrogenase family)
VNSVSPGPVFTEAFQEILGVEDRLDELVRTIPLGRAGTPDDIAAMVLFLCSPAAGWITGEHHLVAGGRTQRSYQYRSRDTGSNESA